ncbi:MAG: T9SS type A sorting domain-containing protein, partial [Bacteroidia bacterium]|nr:T9SS type A sorting domain-containing protein [Bacteroidia bacterium]
DLAEYEITKFIEDGKVQLDYGITGGSGDSRYIVNNQIVTYGEKNFTLDAAVIDISSPSNKIEHGRSNPACVSPKVIIRNNGSDVLYSVKLNYWVNDKSNAKTAYWEGYLRFSEQVEYHLPIDNSVWTTATSGNNTFHVEIIEANGVTDEYANNNVYQSAFEKPEVYPQDIYFFFRMNNAANENSIIVTDDWGHVVYQRDNLVANEVVRDTLRLGIGCHQLRIEDSDDDGIAFWANSDGNGFFRIMEVGGGVLKTLEGDFGGSSVLNFTVLHELDVPELENNYGYQCYPNPTNGLLTIEGYDLSDTKSQIFNSFGQELSLQPTLSNSQIAYDLSNEASGMYMVRMVKNGEVWVSKVIVK